MRQKYLIIPEKNSLTIKESSELDKGIFQQVEEITYDNHVIQVAKEGNIKKLVNALRTPVFYPVTYCATKLAESIVNIYKSTKNDPVEVVFSDIDQLSRDEDKDKSCDSDTSVAIDTLLDDSDSDNDNIEGDDLLKDDNIKGISSTIKIADEDDLVEDDEK
ncbi:MAG: hypothetical protein JRI91_04090 [Deltaproteobacteria bacterium]|nr:hypothetical protein [Deltaproteobacteria bacterium]